MKVIVCVLVVTYPDDLITTAFADETGVVTNDQADKLIESPVQTRAGDDDLIAIHPHRTRILLNGVISALEAGDVSCVLAELICLLVGKIDVPQALVCWYVPKGVANSRRPVWLKTRLIAEAPDGEVKACICRIDLSSGRYDVCEQ